MPARTNRRTPLARLPIGLLALVASPAAAADYHVAPGGSDESAAGSTQAPWRTIGRALNAAQPGDVIVLHNGVYREFVRILQPNITLTSAPGEWAVIQNGFGTNDAPELCVKFDVDASGGALKRLEVVGGYYAVKLESRWDWGGPQRGGVSDILIEDCKIHDSGRDCIKMAPKCNRVTIRRCEVYNSGQLYPPGTPFDSKNAEGIDNVSSDFTLVQDCYVHDTATTGIYFKGGATDCIVERTRVERCGQAGILLGFDTSPEFFDTDANPRYFESIRCIARNCIVEDTNYAGIGMYAASDPLVANNTIVNTAKAGHSPIYFGLTFQDWDPAAGRPASVNAQIVNNLVAQLEPIDSEMVFIRDSPELGGMSALDGIPVMRNNLYFSAGGAPRFGDARPGTALNDADFAGWQAHISGDRDSFIADPRLDADGRLTSASPAIDRGAALSAVKDDFDAESRPAGAALDIGADEFGSSAPRPTPGGVSVETPESGGGEPVGQSPAPAATDTRNGGGDAALDAAAEALDVSSSGLCPASAAAMLALGFVGLLSSRRFRPVP